MKLNRDKSARYKRILSFKHDNYETWEEKFDPLYYHIADLHTLANMHPELTSDYDYQDLCREAYRQLEYMAKEADQHKLLGK